MHESGETRAIVRSFVEQKFHQLFNVYCLLGSRSLPQLWSLRGVHAGKAGAQEYSTGITDRIDSDTEFRNQMRSADEGATILYSVRLQHSVFDCILIPLILLVCFLQVWMAVE